MLKPYPLPTPEEAAKSGFRWTPKRKLAVVEAIKEGRIDYKMALVAYRLTQEELDGWMRLTDEGGTKALRATRAQVYRDRRH